MIQTKDKQLLQAKIATIQIPKVYFKLNIKQLVEAKHLQLFKTNIDIHITFMNTSNSRQKLIHKSLLLKKYGSSLNGHIM